MRVSKENLSPEAPDRSRFFARLADWSGTPGALQVFDEIVNHPIDTPQPVFYARLYHHLIDFLLEYLRLPHTDSPSNWEWKPLYQFGQQVDPYYFTEADIQRMLERWPVIGYEQSRTIVSVLSGFFQLRRAGYPQCFPSPLIPVHDLERWTRIFPPEWAWDSLHILRQLGFSTMASRWAYQAFVRFSEGAFEPRLNSDSLRRWFTECWRVGSLGEQGSSESAHPYRANFVALVFANRQAAMGLAGPCSYIPDCQHCPLNDECRWHNTPANERQGPSEILAMARLGRVEHLRTDQLLQGLFRLSDEEGARLRAKLNGVTLRELASRPVQELDHDFGVNWLVPERLSVTFELCRRFNEERMAVGRTFQTPWDVFKHFRMRLRDLKQEQFIVVLLDNKKRFLSDLVITQGTLNTSPVHPREVFNAAIRERAASVVIVHNHPSGDPQPSREDIHVTQQLIKVGELVGIPVLDHIIIADELYISMLEQGLLKG